ncbi:MAG: 16S rRNA (guanine(527)-N(7))-methyltransferase RsmG [Bryobacter sp.]|nr:16S rRNA (guanine(527)-N(7))-methyltransferase RsmG [Bryobacter sp.]
MDVIIPADLPERPRVLEKTSAHLDLIEQANRTMNLTRILDAEDAAIKHVLDSLIPYRQFAQAKLVADAGTGAGFPGIPLALALPQVEFVLLESIQKKARFVADAIAALELPNVRVVPQRAEDWLKNNSADIVTARAMAPLERLAALLGPVWKPKMRGLFYKGPDSAREIEEAAKPLRRFGLSACVLLRYDLPAGKGERNLLEVVKLRPGA